MVSPFELGFQGDPSIQTAADEGKEDVQVVGGQKEDSISAAPFQLLPL